MALKDITGAQVVEVEIDRRRGVVWVNTEDGCVLRICRIEGVITVKDSAQDVTS